MSRIINTDDGYENLSDEDLQYLADRGRLPEGFELAQDDEEEDDEQSYDSMSKKELVAEIQDRNEGRDEDDQISESGTKDDLIAALEADDEEEG